MLQVILLSVLAGLALATLHLSVTRFLDADLSGVPAIASSIILYPGIYAVFYPDLPIEPFVDFPILVRALPLLANAVIFGAIGAFVYGTKERGWCLRFGAPAVVYSIYSLWMLRLMLQVTSPAA